MKKIILFCFMLSISAVTSLLHAQTWNDEVWTYVDNGDWGSAKDLLMKHQHEITAEDMNLLANCYERLGDHRSAYLWFKKGALGNSSNAQFSMGRFYDHRYGAHEGVVQNDEQAKKHYWQSIRNLNDISAGSKASVVNLYIILSEENKMDELKSMLEFACSRKVNLREAPYLLATLFYSGTESALYYHRISAENGFSLSQFILAEMLRDGEFIEKDLKEATKWFRKAADQGHSLAKEALGKCYYELYIKTLDERYLRYCIKYYYPLYTENNESGAPMIIKLKNQKMDKDGTLVSADALDPLYDLYTRGVLNADKYETYEDWLNEEVKFLALESDVDVNIPHTDHKNNSFVMIFSNENYVYENKVPYGENDGEVVAKYFEYTLGIPAKNIRLVKDAGLNTMRRRISNAVDEAKIRGYDHFYFYFIGHGVPSGDQSTSFLLPVDGYAKDVETGLDIKWLYGQLEKTGIQTTVFLDACFSGYGRDQQILVEARGVAIKAKNVLPKGKTVVFSACQNVEMAYSFDEQKHGLFTYYVLKHLQQSKGDSTFGEFADYIIKNVSRTALEENMKTQTPSVVVSPQLQTVWRNLSFK